MKRVLSLLVFIMVLNGCDDGNLIQEDINFEDIETTQSCTNGIIYKLKEKEALLIEIPETSFVNEPGTTEVTISTTNRVVYRFYNGTVAADNICETISPATPIVIDQWNAIDGTIQIITTAVKTTNTTDNSTTITGYNHNITFKNITFAKNNGTQVYETFPFGDYVTTATQLSFDFDATIPLNKCATTNEIYKFTTSETLMLNIDPSLIINEITPTDTPRKGIISTTQNILTYRLFASGGLLTDAYFCNATTPTTPTLSQEWNGVAGITDISGIIEVTTTTSGPNSFKHTIVLKKVSLNKGNSTFSLGDNYIYGELFTTN